MSGADDVAAVYRIQEVAASFIFRSGRVSKRVRFSVRKPKPVFSNR